MYLLYLIGGLAILFFVFFDLITTTLSMQGGGRITEFISRKIWKLFYLSANKKGRSPLLDHAGYIILLVIVLTWVLAVWLGFFLLLLSDPASVLNSSNNIITTSWEKLYYAGYTITTMGNGDFKPGSALWQIVTNVFALFGLALITISITYIMPVISAAILQVKLSVFINCLGQTPQEIIINGYNGENFNRLFKHDADLSQDIIKHSQNHKAYPIIHYFHNSQVKRSIVVTISCLDEAVSILEKVIIHDKHPNAKDLSLLKGALNFYLEVMNQSLGQISNHHPYEPDLSTLAREGISIVHEQNLNSAEETQKRRALLGYLLENEGWSWKDVYTRDE